MGLPLAFFLFLSPPSILCQEAGAQLAPLLQRAEGEISSDIPSDGGSAVWWQEVALSRHLLVQPWDALWASLRGLEEEWTPRGSIHTGIYLYWMDGFEESAESFLRCGLTEGEESMEARETLALLLTKAGRNREALLEIRAARALAPNDQTLALVEEMIQTGERPYGTLDISRLDACHKEVFETLDHLANNGRLLGQHLGQWDDNYNASFLWESFSFDGIRESWVETRELAMLSYSEYLDRFIRPFAIPEEMDLDLKQAHLAFRQSTFNHGIRSCIEAIGLALLFETKHQTTSSGTIDAFWAEAIGAKPGDTTGLNEDLWEEHNLKRIEIQAEGDRRFVACEDAPCMRASKVQECQSQGAELARLRAVLDLRHSKASLGIDKARENLLSYYFSLAVWGGSFAVRWIPEMVADAAFLNLPNSHPLSIYSVLELPQKLGWQEWGQGSQSWRLVEEFLDQREVELSLATPEANDYIRKRVAENAATCAAAVESLEALSREPTDWDSHWGGFDWSPRCDAKLDGLTVSVGWTGVSLGFSLPGTISPSVGATAEYRSRRIETTMGAGLSSQGGALSLSPSAFGDNPSLKESGGLTGALFLGSPTPIQVGLELSGEVRLVRHVGSQTTSVLATVRPGLGVRMAKGAVEATCSLGTSTMSWTPRAGTKR